MREITLAQTIKTIDKLLNAFKNIRPKNTILIIDESHLLQDHIGFRKKLIQKMCKLLFSNE